MTATKWLKIANEARDDATHRRWMRSEEEQVKFFADQGCGESESPLTSVVSLAPWRRNI